jgi:hypothetical protein
MGRVSKRNPKGMYIELVLITLLITTLWILLTHVV